MLDEDGAIFSERIDEIAFMFEADKMEGWTRPSDVFETPRVNVCFFVFPPLTWVRQGTPRVCLEAIPLSREQERIGPFCLILTR